METPSPPPPFYALCASSQLDAQLANYAQTSRVVATAHFNEQRHCYGYYTAEGMLVHCGGLIEALRSMYYPHIDKDAQRGKKRRWTKVKLQGSTASVGKRVDAQLVHCVAHGRPPNRPHKWTRALLAHWRGMGHTLQAAQLPVLLERWGRLTQADVITRDSATGQLWLWEVKTGYPVGASRKNGVFALAPFSEVPCTVFAQWQLQLHFTRRALHEHAGVAVAQSRVIQIYGEKGQSEPIIKVHDPPAWLPPQAQTAVVGPMDLLLLREQKRRKLDEQNVKE